MYKKIYKSLTPIVRKSNFLESASSLTRLFQGLNSTPTVAQVITPLDTLQSTYSLPQWDTESIIVYRMI